MQELRDRMIPIRVSYNEHKTISNRAKRVNKNVSAFMRESALGVEIKERPDDRFYECLKDLRYIRAGLKNIANTAHYTQNVDDEKYSKQIEKIDKFILDIKQKYLNV